MADEKSVEKIEKVLDLGSGDYYFIFPPSTNPELIRKKISQVSRTFLLYIGLGLTLASLILEIAAKPRLIKLHGEFGVEVPVYTRLSLLISLLILFAYFAFVLARDRKLEYASQKLVDGRIKVTPFSKQAKLKDLALILVLLLYTIFLILVMFGPFYMIARG